jgi:hypothetical protein
MIVICSIDVYRFIAIHMQHACDREQEEKFIENIIIENVLFFSN